MADPNLRPHPILRPGDQIGGTSLSAGNFYPAENAAAVLLTGARGLTEIRSLRNAVLHRTASRAAAEEWVDLKLAQGRLDHG